MAHGPWITQHTPDFGPGIKERFEMASRITAEVGGGGLPFAS